MNAVRRFWDKSFTDIAYRLTLHAGFWLFLLFFWMRESVVLHVCWQQHYSVTLVGIGLALFLFYPLVYGLIPLLQKKRWLIAFACFAAYYIAAVTLRSYHIQQVVDWYNLKNTWVVGQDFWASLYKHQLNPVRLTQTFFSSLTSLADIIFIPLTIKFLRSAYRSQLRQAWLAQQNVQLQLTSLKAQINPHFFFNTLNNLQSFIVHQEQARSLDLLTRLADFMRTTLYECTSEYISMQLEMDLVSNYVAIERIRFDDRAAIDYAWRNQDPTYLIPPFIFLPFIENAFKHGGRLPTDEVLIHIELLNEPSELRLTTRNAYRSGQEGEDKGGIGLQTVHKRLAYYFPNQYRLVSGHQNGFYSVALTIQKG